MAKRAIARTEMRPVRIGCFLLTSTGMDVRGRPSFAEYEAVGEFINRAHRASGFWLGDWLRYGELRKDWHDRLEQAQQMTGLSLKTLKNVRAVAGSVDKSRRRDDVEFSLHATVAGLDAKEQTEWLERAQREGWETRELRLEIHAAKRRKVIDGQAVLRGMYRVIYADFPWLYGDRQPSGSSAQRHYAGMTVEQGCELPVKAHARPNSVLFFWVPAPILLENPGPRDIIHAWGFEPKTGIVWDKVEHNVGSYVSVRHEHLIIATRGSCTPDHPTPMIDSVVTERRQGPHSAKPETFRKIIERMYDGPYLELFGRERVDGWDVFGNDARLWAEQAEAAS